MFINGIDPAFNTIERTLTRDIKGYKDPVGLSVERIGDCFKFFLSSCVPDLNAQNFVIVVTIFVSGCNVVNT